MAVFNISSTYVGLTRSLATRRTLGIPKLLKCINKAQPEPEPCYKKHSSGAGAMLTKTELRSWSHFIFTRAPQSWFDQYQNLFEFVQKEHQPNAICCKMMEHERLAKYVATCNPIECFRKLIKITQLYFSVMAHYANVERFFPWCSQKPKKREIFLTEPVSILSKLVCN